MAKEAKVYRGQVKKAGPVPFRRKKVLTAQIPCPISSVTVITRDRKDEVLGLFSALQS